MNLHIINLISLLMNRIMLTDQFNATLTLIV